MNRTTLSLALVWAIFGAILSACGGDGLAKIPTGDDAALEGSRPDAALDAHGGDGAPGDASNEHEATDAGEDSPGMDGTPPFDAGEDVTVDAGCTGPSECPKTGSACVVALCSMGACGTTEAAMGTPCSDHGGDVCNGSGQCVSSDGSPCSAPGECESDHCSGDGYCCDLPCKGSCQTCNTGTCADIAEGETTFGCDGASACDGAGHCLEDLGGFCSLGTQCLSGECSADGYCCDTACDGACETCSSGTCADVYAGETTATCEGTSACDGSGDCLENLGYSCSDGTQCASGNCSSDGVCCAESCIGSCVECSTFYGEFCDDVEELGTTATCEGTNACDGMGDCLLADGQSCTLPDQCASGHCGKLLVCK